MKRTSGTLIFALIVWLFVFCISFAQETTWEELFPADKPSERAWHNMVYDSVRDVVVLFGGYDYTVGQCLNETWEWDGSNWAKVHDGSGIAPGPRARHAMVFDSVRGKTVLFGGACSGSFYDDTWEWDGSNWIQKTVAGPPARICKASAFDKLRGVMVVFGGYNGSNLLCDIWEWNSSSWVDKTPADVDSLIAAGLWPEKRFESAMAFDPVNKRCLLYGGEISYSPWRLDDTWHWDGTNWEFVSNSGYPRHNHAMVTDSKRGLIILFGGNALGSEFLNNTFEWDGAAWQEILVENSPPGRQSPALAFDQNSSRTLLFGGYIAHLTAINDTWEYGIPCTELEITVTDGEGVEHPGYSTIQEAVDSVTGSGWVISVGSGEFDEYPIIIGKDNLMIKTACDAEIQGLDIRQCTDILIEGFEIVPTGLGKHGIDLNGGISRNIGVTIANCDIHGADNSYSGIAAWRNTEDLTVTGCHIYENGRNGVVFLDATGGPHYLTGNLIENNGWNGVRVAYAHYITLTSNVINNNGTKTGITGGRYGVLRGAVNGGGYPERITLLNNEIRYNHGNVVLDKSSIDLGNYHQMLDEGDSGNITTGGDEGPGVSH